MMPCHREEPRDANWPLPARAQARSAGPLRKIGLAQAAQRPKEADHFGEAVLQQLIHGGGTVPHSFAAGWSRMQV